MYLNTLLNEVKSISAGCVGRILLGLLFIIPTVICHAASYVGAETCRTCHQAEYKNWKGSHHDLAMQEANDKSVLGNFDNVEISQYGVTSKFYKKDNNFMVLTEGATGAIQEFQIKYTFGLYPLQQYLIEFPGGRMQALSLAWDTRSKEEGGQRWFHLYPDEKIAYDDELHWTHLSQNWNTMCVDCHSTGVKKNYDASSKTFATTWEEVNVSCEACHGPGSDHIIWAENKTDADDESYSLGLALKLDERKNIHWNINSKTGKPERSEARKSDKEIETCARCHSRRSPISEGHVHGDRLLDHYFPSTLEDGMYFADGQIDDEVYVYGSFLQSKMYAAGVTCSDCHEPHSQQLRQPENGVCLQCHQADQYNQPGHHFHEQESAGASCAECHMPPKNYMVLDPRHDHSMRIPRPDLSVTLGTPNACNNCHQDQTAEWASKQIKAWYIKTPKGFQNYAEVLHAARNDQVGVGNDLATLIRNTDTPDIARATSLLAIGPQLTARTIDVLPLTLSDDDAAVRAAAVGTLMQVPLNLRVRLAFPMLDDPILLVRIEAARVLSSLEVGELDDEQKAILEKAMGEYIASQQSNAERPEAQTNLGNLYAAKGQVDKAEKAYKTAIEIEPAFVSAYVNLADLYRAQDKEKEAEQILLEAMKSSPNSGALHYGLGLSLVRQKRMDDALEQLKMATELNPENAHFNYLYAIALNSTGKTQQAILILKVTHSKHPNNPDILSALVSIHRDIGEVEAAQSYAEKLKHLSR